MRLRFGDVGCTKCSFAYKSSATYKTNETLNAKSKSENDSPFYEVLYLLSYGKRS